jgi:hypothetical protein
MHKIILIKYLQNDAKHNGEIINTATSLFPSAKLRGVTVDPSTFEPVGNIFVDEEEAQDLVDYFNANQIEAKIKQ